MKLSFTGLVEVLKDFYYSLKNVGNNHPQLPLYPNSISIEKFENPDFPDSQVTIFTTPDSFETVCGFYKKKLTRDGWELENESQAEGKIHFLYRHPRRYYSWPYPRKKTRHGKKNLYNYFAPWNSLSFSAKYLDNLLQVEIDYRILRYFKWFNNKV
jgi:hypothetical protein